jgi:hypothetical protein
MSSNGVNRIRQLWDIQGSGGAASVTRVVAGETPSGFTQVVGLGATPSADAELDFVVHFDFTQLDRPFRIQDLRADEVLVDSAWFGNHSRVSLDRFDQENARDCG